ncbi:DNase I-like protein, partial [Exidia glandulosa HHB12029]
MAIQETHLDAGHLATIATLWPSLHVINSAHANATSTAGIAIVLNKSHLLNPEKTSHWEIIPGRALLAQIKWRDREVFILAVYGPNGVQESKDMWSSIDTWLDEHKLEIPAIDIIMGDMNFVEDEIDRVPTRLAAVDEAEESFRSLKLRFDLQDGWRKLNGDRKEYTWRRPGSRERSRLDRIYLKSNWTEESRHWQCKPALPSSDHWMVSVDLTDNLCPEVGEGRWAMPNAVTEDYEFKAILKPRTQQFLRDVKHARANRTTARNPQTVFETFKDDVGQHARSRGAAVGSTAKREEARLDSERKRTENDPTIDEETRQ